MGIHAFDPQKNRSKSMSEGQGAIIEKYSKRMQDYKRNAPRAHYGSAVRKDKDRFPLCQ